MNILCFDTGSQSVNVTAQGERGTFFSSFTSENRKSNSNAQILLPTIESAIKQAGFKIQETQILICPQGPGSFTGLRIAYSVAKAIQLQTNAEFYSVPVLEVMEFLYGKYSKQFLSIIDAKRGCFYCQLFENRKLKMKPKDMPALEIIKFLDIETPITVCGSGIDTFIEDISGSKDVFDILKQNMNFIEFDLANLSKNMLECYNRGFSCIEVSDYDGPVYIRPSDAEN